MKFYVIRGTNQRKKMEMKIRGQKRGQERMNALKRGQELRNECELSIIKKKRNVDRSKLALPVSLIKTMSVDVKQLHNATVRCQILLQCPLNFSDVIKMCLSDAIRMSTGQRTSDVSECVSRNNVRVVSVAGPVPSVERVDGANYVMHSYVFRKVLVYEWEFLGGVFVEDTCQHLAQCRNSWNRMQNNSGFACTHIWQTAV